MRQAARLPSLGAPFTLVGPSLLHRRTPSSYIYLWTPNDQIRSQKPNSTTATFCIHEIPSCGLFRSSVGWGIDHGGLLHQHHSPSDEVWVVHLRPTGPLLVARWLLLSFWISIQCSPPLLWRSIRCNLLLRCVCWDRWIVGLWSSLSMNNIWIFSEFFYVWLVIFASLFELSVWFGLLDWSFLQWEKCLALGSILRCPFPVTVGAARHVLYCCHRGYQDGVYIIFHEFIPLHHVIFLNMLLCSYELNTLDACWIAVDVWSNSSKCRQESVYLSRTCCLYTWSYLDILINMLNSVNCSTVICSPTVILMLLREASSETYGPRVYFPSY